MAKEAGKDVLDREHAEKQLTFRPVTSFSDSSYVKIDPMQER